MGASPDARDPTASAPASRRRRLALALGLLLSAAVLAVAILVATDSSSPPRVSNAFASGAATVQRRDLVENDTESGTLGYAGPQTVYDRLSGTVTWLPAVGRVIEPGQTLYGVNGRPVVLLDGALSAYRTLKAKDSDGQDILQLNSDLVRMGFADGEITVDDAWQTGTTDAVKRWQASLGEKQTGKIPLGRIVFLPGPQRVTQLDSTCGSTGGGGSGGASSSGSGSGPTNGCGVTNTSVATSIPTQEFVSLTRTTTTTATPTTTTTTTTTTAPPTTSTTTTTGPRTTTSAAKPHHRSGSKSGGGSGSGGNSGSAGGSGSAGASGSSSGKGSGNGGSSASGSGKKSNGAGGGAGTGSASAIMQTTSTKLVVTVDLDPSKQSEARAGDHVTVELPAGNTVAGTVSAISPVAQSSNNSGGGSGSGSGGGGGGGGGSGSSGSTIPVTVTLSGHLRGAGLDQAAVSVEFEQARARNVLSVPVTALLAIGGGGYAVQTASAPHKLFPVATGLFAAGYVEISGAGIHPGLEVTDSQG